ncbi:MAG: response regulator transcription factor [Gammaproteobacteria bacterium]|nr:response regulator transcription factor [Gammaproteobacteria bacterium]
MTFNLLAIDDDSEVTSFLTTFFAPFGYQLTVATDGDIAIKRALNQPFDAIFLELMLPQKNGFEVLKTIRQHQQTPIIILTTRTHDIDRTLGFELGADDYLEKPCNPHELFARLQAIFRRTQKTLPQRATFNEDGILLDAAKRLVIKNKATIELTNTEFNILEMLMRSPGQAFSKEELTEYALGRKYGAFDRSIDVHISHLRVKLGNNKRQEACIKTIRGFGYAFNV